MEYVLYISFLIRMITSVLFIKLLPPDLEKASEDKVRQLYLLVVISDLSGICIMISSAFIIAKFLSQYF